MSTEKSPRKKYKTKVIANPDGGVTISVKFPSKRLCDAYTKALTAPPQDSEEVRP